VEKVITETQNIKTLIFRPEEKIGFAAGQFMLVTIPGMGECAFTPSSDPAVPETIEFTIMKAGSVTAAIHALKEGEAVGLRGPYGKPYPIKDFHGKEVYVVGGGVGLAPLRALLFALNHEIASLKKVEVRFGARSVKDISYRAAIEEWKKREKTNIVISLDAPDPQWSGNVGLVTTILKDGDVEPKNAVAVVCGPPIMYKFVMENLVKLGIPKHQILMTLERRMKCGVGKCGHCAIEYLYTCIDGPVFTYWDVLHMKELIGRGVSDKVIA